MNKCSIVEVEKKLLLFFMHKYKNEHNIGTMIIKK